MAPARQWFFRRLMLREKSVLNPMVRLVHDRMPVIIPEGYYNWWLDEHTGRDTLKKRLVPFPAGGMACVRVSARVNNARFDGPERFEPA
jgi:putative SOS response-associated peptidase YedK